MEDECHDFAYWFEFVKKNGWEDEGGTLRTSTDPKPRCKVARVNDVEVSDG